MVAGGEKASAGAAGAAAAPRRRRVKRPGIGHTERRLAADLGTAELEAIVFGRAAPAVGGKAEAEVPQGAGAAADDGGSEVGENVGDEAPDEGRKRKAAPAAWHDPDDAALEVDLTARNRMQKLRRSEGETTVTGEEYERRLREQFVKLHGHARWAEEAVKPRRAAQDDSSDGEEEIGTSAKLVGQAPVGEGALPPIDIKMTRRKDLPMDDNAKRGPALIQALQFHPRSELLLSAGFDKRLRLYAVDGEENPKVSSHFFKKFPIKEASFTPDGDQVLITGRGYEMWGLDVRTGTALSIKPLAAQAHKLFHGLAVGPDPADQPGLRAASMYSVLGDSGAVVLCDAATKHQIRTFRMAAAGVAAVFSPSKDSLFTADEACNIYEWDLGSGRCVQKAKDPWATQITTLALRRTSQYSPTPVLAVGTASGNIDLFDLGNQTLPKEPTRSVPNLVTAVSSLAFHHSGELLAAASLDKKDSLKLVHMGAGSVFAEWPTIKTPLQRVSALALSRTAGFLAIGNERGRVLLYQVGHYERGVR